MEFICHPFTFVTDILHVGFIPQIDLVFVRFASTWLDVSVDEHNVMIPDPRHRLTIVDVGWSICEDQVESMFSSSRKGNNLLKTRFQDCSEDIIFHCMIVAVTKKIFQSISGKLKSIRQTFCVDELCSLCWCRASSCSHPESLLVGGLLIR